MLWLLGLLDLLSGITLIMLRFNIGEFFAWFFVIYLIIKSAIFFTNFVSLVDVFAAIMFVLAIYGIYNALTWVAVIWLLQKAFFSMA